VFYSPTASLFFMVYFLLLVFELSVPVQVISWKDSSLKNLLCVERDVKLYSVTHPVYRTFADRRD